MNRNRWIRFACWVLAGSLCAKNALEYLLGGKLSVNSDLRNTLVFIQLVFGILVIAYGFKFLRQKSIQ